MLVQTSLFDPQVDPAGPFETESSSLGSLAALTRHQLARGAWVDLLPSWASDDDLLDSLLADVPWRAERRPMYDRVVDVPRLLCMYGEGAPLPHPALSAMRDVLNERYAPELGEPLVSAGLCLYRDGSDSVAWHGDTLGRGRSHDTVVAIVSLGSPRDFLLRPRGGGAVARAMAGAASPSHAASPFHVASSGSRAAERPVTRAGTIRHTLQHGDLVVMGGSCQRTWEHAIPKTSRAVGPRVSIQFRPRGVS